MMTMETARWASHEGTTRALVVSEPMLPPAAVARPVVLTTSALLHTHERLVAALRAARFVVQGAVSFEGLLRQAEEAHPDVVLVDFDAAERSHASRRDMVSGFRLVTLLAAPLRRRASALIVMTTLDYAEIEDLSRVGVHAFVSPRSAEEGCVAQVTAALARRRAQRPQAVPARAGVMPARMPALPAPTLAEAPLALMPLPLLETPPVFAL